MSLNIVDWYPSSEATSVPLNALVWVQFNQRLNWSAAMSNYYMAVSEYTSSTAVAGEITLSTDKTTITFTPSTLFKPNTKYLVVIFGGITGVSSGSGSGLVHLDDSFSFDFVTGTSTQADGDSVQPSGVPEASSSISIESYLTVESTTPNDGAYNQDVNLSSIEIEFSEVPVLPSGMTWLDMINIDRAGVLG